MRHPLGEMRDFLILGGGGGGGLSQRILSHRKGSQSPSHAVKREPKFQKRNKKRHSIRLMQELFILAKNRKNEE